MFTKIVFQTVLNPCLRGFMFCVIIRNFSFCAAGHRGIRLPFRAASVKEPARAASEMTVCILRRRRFSHDHHW
jgi:hypothetical protein